jgi:hypothetical protein
MDSTAMVEDTTVEDTTVEDIIIMMEDIIIMMIGTIFIRDWLSPQRSLLALCSTTALLPA